MTDHSNYLSDSDNSLNESVRLEIIEIDELNVRPKQKRPRTTARKFREYLI